MQRLWCHVWCHSIHLCPPGVVQQQRLARHGQLSQRGPQRHPAGQPAPGPEPRGVRHHRHQPAPEPDQGTALRGHSVSCHSPRPRGFPWGRSPREDFHQRGLRGWTTRLFDQADGSARLSALGTPNCFSCFLWRQACTGFRSFLALDKKLPLELTQILSCPGGKTPHQQLSQIPVISPSPAGFGDVNRSLPSSSLGSYCVASGSKKVHLVQVVVSSFVGMPSLVHISGRPSGPQFSVPEYSECLRHWALSMPSGTGYAWGPDPWGPSSGRPLGLSVLCLFSLCPSFCTSCLLNLKHEIGVICDYKIVYVH